MSRGYQRKVALVGFLLMGMGAGCGRSLDDFHRFPDRDPGRLLQAQQKLVAETAWSRKYELRIADGRGQTFDYFFREPQHRRGPLPAVFILAGFETGRDSLDFIDERDDVFLLSMNYPYRGPLVFQGLGWLRALPTFRRLAIETLEGGVLALDYLANRGDVDPERIILLGVSFGSIFITNLGALDPRPDAVVLIYGGGDLPFLARHNLRNRPWWIPSWLIGPLVRAFLGEFEPLARVEEITPRYFLMISSRQDDMFPPSSALALFEQAREPKKLIWHETGHMDLFDPKLIRLLTGEVVGELRKVGYLPGPETPSYLPPLFGR